MAFANMQYDNDTVRPLEKLRILESLALGLHALILHASKNCVTLANCEKCALPLERKFWMKIIVWCKYQGQNMTYKEGEGGIFHGDAFI